MRFERAAGVVLGIAVLLLGAGTASGAARTPTATPGTTIVPGPTDPAEVQFVPGGTNVVPPTAAPATDIGTTKIQSAAAPFYACPGFSGLDCDGPGDATRTIIFQVPFQQALPPGAVLVKQAQTNPIQGWVYPSSYVRKSAPTIMLARSGKTASILSFVVPVRASGGVTYKTYWSGTTFVVSLDVGGRAVAVAISGGGSLYRAG